MILSNSKHKVGWKTTRSLLAIFLFLSVVFNAVSFALLLPKAYAHEPSIETIRRRNLVIDLGDGLKTDAQLTIPTVGDGPFPGVLLIHGSGNIDMDGYIPHQLSGTEDGSRILLQIAEYLSERGFAVLRYNKRSIGLNGTIINMNSWGNLTVQDLIQDAESALNVLRQQPEVDSSRISLIGHSEGTMIAPRIAVKDPSIANIVLMGAGAQNLYEIVRFQIVDRPLICAQDIFDTNHDGQLSLQEVEYALKYENINLSPLPPLALIQNNSGECDWQPGLDADNNGYFDIENELKPLQTAMFELYTSSDPESPYYWIWLQSHFALKETALDIIGNVSASILILQGEGDTQTIIEQAFLLEQRLTEVKHPDHTLISYPGLGHTFYPADGWIQPLGPIQEKVLADLQVWLMSPSRTVHDLNAQIRANTKTIDGLEIQLNNQTQLLFTKLDATQNETCTLQAKLTNDLNAQNVVLKDLQSSLNKYTIITYAALGIASISIIRSIMIQHKIKHRTSNS